ncbi:MAG: hypothetical protein HDS14_00420 [Bacteroides sp.]|nr:hypothetical protein [Bacteroides sp.]
MISQQLYEYISGWLAESVLKLYARQNPNTNRKLTGCGRSKKSAEYYTGIISRLSWEAMCRNSESCILTDQIRLYVYNGRFFESVDNPRSFIRQALKEMFLRLEIGEYVHRTSVLDNISKECTETILNSSRYLYIPDRKYIAFENRIFNLDTGRALEFNIKYRPFIHLDIEYHEQEELYRLCEQKYGYALNPCRLWDKTIGAKPINGAVPGILPNDNIREDFRQWCGTILLDPERFKSEYACFLYGPGANGKSVLANVIGAVFGEKYVSRLTITQLFKEANGQEANLASLKGKLVNLVGDMTDTDLSSNSLFKEFASKGLMEVRVPYATAPIKVAATPLLCCTNKIPESKDDSEGFHRRFMVIATTKYQYKGEDRDPQLTAKLSAPEARMYIFHWIYKGYRKVVRNGGDIDLSDDTRYLNEAIADESNSVRRWWARQGYIPVMYPEPKNDPRWRSVMSLYNEYRSYAEQEGNRAVRYQDFLSMLRNRGFSQESGNEKKLRGAGLGVCIEKPQESELEK